MPRSGMTRRAITSGRRDAGTSGLLIVLTLLVPARATGQASAPPPTPLGWHSLATPDLTIVGGAPEGTLRRVGFVLRRFRDAVAPVLPAATHPPGKPTTVIVFPRREQMAPFATRVSQGPYYEAGLFLGGMTSNYILMTTADDGFDIAYHEYVHLIVHQHLERAPAWFNEGLAEFFRTFSVDADGLAYIGNVPAPHIELLRRQGLMPLVTLLGAGFDSSLYKEHDTASVFYAQSWLLVHYFMLADQGRKAADFMTFVGQLIAGVEPERASQAAFKYGLGTLDDELKAYLARDAFPRQRLPTPPRQGIFDESPMREVTEADAHTVQGEVLLAMGRYDGALEEFRAALTADPAFPRAHAGYGQVLAQQGRDEEARAHLALAASAPDASWATLVTYAAALYGLRSTHGVDSPGPDDRAIEQALRRAIALEPSRPLGYVHLARLLSRDSRRLIEAHQLISRAMTQAPDDEELRLVYAAILVNGMRYVAARPVLEALTQARSPEIRLQAGQLLADVEALLARTVGRSAEDVGLVPPAVRSHADGVPIFRELRPGEDRAAGRLTAIECVPNGLILVTRTARGTLRVSARSLESVQLLSYSRRTGPVKCGASLQGTVVVVSYVPASTGPTHGRLTALEFAPEGFIPAGM